MTHKVRFTKTLRTRFVQYRLQFTEDLPFVPFVGLGLAGYTDAPRASDMVIEQVTWNRHDQVFECALPTKTTTSTKEELAAIYGPQWAIDSAPLG